MDEPHAPDHFLRCQGWKRIDPREPRSETCPMVNPLIARFEITVPSFQPESFWLPDGVYTVGRGESNELIVKDKSVSREHCELHLYGPEVIVRECASRNGILVDEIAVNGQKGVRHGQSIRLGKVVIRVFLNGTDEGQTSVYTAIDDLRKFERSSDQDVRNSPSLPLVFGGMRKK